VQGGRYGNALQAASYRGHEAVVKMLLDKGAEVNAQGGFYSNALQAASSGGYEAMVKVRGCADMAFSFGLINEVTSSGNQR
jgi:ankyrin repeat protein